MRDICTYLIEVRVLVSLDSGDGILFKGVYIYNIHSFNNNRIIMIKRGELLVMCLVLNGFGE